jgi:hypothetical protein
VRDQKFALKSVASTKKGLEYRTRGFRKGQRCRLGNFNSWRDAAARLEHNARRISETGKKHGCVSLADLEDVVRIAPMGYQGGYSLVVGNVGDCAEIGISWR